MSGVMAWDSNHAGQIWNEFILRKDTAITQFRGDGEYLNGNIPKYDRELLQHKYPGKLKSYKYQIYNKGIDKETSIICFHGRPSIIQAMKIRKYIILQKRVQELFLLASTVKIFLKVYLEN